MLKQLQEEFNQEEFTVVALSVDRRVEDVQRFIKRSEVNYPVAMADRKTLHEFGDIPGVPVILLINKQGHILRKYPGYVPHKLLHREISKMLED